MKRSMIVLAGLAFCCTAAATTETITAVSPPTLGPWTTCDISLSDTRPGVPHVVFKRVPMAVSDPQQHAGLNARASTGTPLMLFTWHIAERHPFWMKGVTIPISVAFIGPDGRVIGLESMKPHTTVFHWSPGPIVAALEAETPLLERAGIVYGTQIDITHCTSPTKAGVSRD